MREAERFSTLLGLELVEGDDAIAIDLNGSELQFLSSSQLESRLEVLPRFPLMEHWRFARYRLRLTVGTSIVSLLVVCR